MSEIIKYNFMVLNEDNGLRIDAYLAKNLETYSRSFIKKAIDEGCVFVNGNIVKASYKLNQKDEITANIVSTLRSEVLGQDIELDILYEDSDIIVVNKPQGMVVHPATGNYENTLVNALIYHCKGTLSKIGGSTRPGIVHRIDKDTSGILIAAKNDYVHSNLICQFKTHSINRNYFAILHGVVCDNKTVIKAPIGRSSTDRKKMAVTEKNSKYAETLISVIKRYKEYTFADACLKTGRTHQIRVHAQYISHPVVGDKVYGYKKKNSGLISQMLHAYKLGFVHPKKNEYMEFSTALPERFEKFLSGLE